MNIMLSLNSALCVFDNQQITSKLTMPFKSTTSSPLISVFAVVRGL